MKNYYKKSRIIIGILAVLISLIALINEDISMKVIVTLFIFGIAFGTSFLTVPISEKMIKVGDAITNKILRVLFYCAMLPLTLLVAYILHILILAIFDRSSGSINAAVLTVFLYIATTVMVIVPYVQTIIVLIYRAKSFKRCEKNENKV